MRPSARVLLLAGVFALKAIVLAELHDHPLLQPEGILDSAVYVGLAQRVMAGDPLLGPEVYFVSPFYIYFLAVCFAISGGSLLAAKLAQIALGTAAVGLIFATTRHWYGLRSAWIAAALAATTGVLTFNEILLLQSALDPFLAALALFLLSRAQDKQRLRDFVATGLALGCFALNRPNALVFAGSLVLFLPLVPPSKGAWRRALALACGIALPIAPVALRNAVAAGDLVLISSHGGLNFYIGNNPDADGTYHRVPGITPSIEGQARDARVVAEKAVGRPLRASEVSGYFYAQAWTWIHEHPGMALSLFLRKMAYLFNAIDLSLNYSYAYYSGDEPTLLRALIAGPWLLVPLGLWGLFAGTRRPGTSGFGLWAAFVPLYALSVAAFFVSSRYRLPLLVPLCVGAGAAVERLIEATRRRQAGTLATHLAALAALGLLANWDFGLDDGRAEERTQMILHLVDTGRDAEAQALLTRTEPTHPEKSLLYGRVAQAFRDRGQTAPAIDLLEKALRAEPGRAEIHLALGQALAEAARWEEAIPHLRAGRDGGARPDVAGFDLAQALGATGQTAEAREALRRIRPSQETGPRSFLTAGRLAMALKDPALAEGFLTEAVRRTPNSAEARETLGMALAFQGRRPAAIGHLEEACRLDPSRATAQLNLAVVYAQLGRWEEARGRARGALRLQPDYPQARGLLAELERK